MVREMIVFFKGKVINNVSYIFFSNVQDCTLPIMKVLALAERPPTGGTINFGKEKKIDKLTKELEQSILGDIEYLDIFDNSGQTIITFQKSFAYLEFGKPVYRMTFIKSFADTFDTEVKLYAVATELGDIEYGYTRFLREDYSTVTQKKVVSGLLGGISSTVTPEAPEWLINPEQLLNGAFKGFYPLNYFNPKTLNLVKEHIGDVKLVSHSQNDCLFCIDELAQKELKKNRTLKKYLHFTST